MNLDFHHHLVLTPGHYTRFTHKPGAMVFFLPSRQTVTKTAGFFGGMYLARTYLRERLEDVKLKMEAENEAKEKCVTYWLS
mgnify:FL=1